MIELASGRRFTYAQMHNRVGRVAAMLKAKGIKKGDRVGFLTLNSSDTLEVIFGCWRLGAVCLAINFRLTPPEIAWHMNRKRSMSSVFSCIVRVRRGRQRALLLRMV